MAVQRVKKGLDLPLTGQPEQEIGEPGAVRHVAILAADYIGMRPTMHVQVDDVVRRGQLLFEDKKTPGVRFTAPGAGRVAAIHRGARRALQSVVVELSESERQGTSNSAEEAGFSSFTGGQVSGLDSDRVRELLVESGLWTAFRTRPFDRVPALDASPDAVFVNAMDSHPLAPSMDVVLEGHEGDLERGLAVLAKLTDGSVFVCLERGSSLQVPGGEPIRREEFSGPHPAGTVGLHIHRLAPVSRTRSVWHLGAQDVVAIGKLFQTGELWTERIVALGGPLAQRPRLLRTRLGASIDELTAGEVGDGELRVLSGSALSGRPAEGEVIGYLGRYHQQVSVLAEGRERKFMGWLAPGLNDFSVSKTFLSTLLPGRRFALNTSTHGSPRAIVPIGLYEKVMAFDIEPTMLLKSLVMRDTERAEELGCLELSEEDLDLLSFVCPGKQEYGPDLRDVLNTIEKDTRLPT